MQSTSVRAEAPPALTLTQKIRATARHPSSPDTQEKRHTSVKPRLLERQAAHSNTHYHQGYCLEALEVEV